MDILHDALGFAARGFIVFATIAAIFLFLAALLRRLRPAGPGLRVRPLNKQIHALGDALRAEVIGKKQLRKLLKQRKKAERAGQARPNVFVLDFKGDLFATAVRSLRQEVSAIITVAGKEDEVVVRLESAGGAVPHYGLAAAQLLRLRDKAIQVTVCIDRIAASGGYMMACVADRIVAAPFAIIGSIGVVAQVPNLHRLLKKHEVDFQEMTAGEFKRTVSVFGEITERGRKKLQEELEDTHLLLKEFVKSQRPKLDLDKVATGEHWLARRGLDLGLVDQLRTSDEYLLGRAAEMNLYRVAFERVPTLRERLGRTVAQAVDQSLSSLLARGLALAVACAAGACQSAPPNPGTPSGNVPPVSPVSPQAQPSPPKLRLPPGARPTRVTAELTIDPRQDGFSGVEQIELAVDQPLPVLWLNADLIEITGSEPAATVVAAPPSFAGLQFATPLPAGSATVTIRWKGRLSRTDNEGAFRQQENGEWYVLTQGEPLGMRRILPCFDEPSYKIPWRISLRVPKADAAFFNTPQVSSDESGEMKLVRFAETKPLPSYLLAFGVGPFERVDAGKVKSGAPVGIVVTRGKTAWARYSALSSPKLMDILEDWFGIPYHYPKLDLIEVPLGGGAMENPGLITFAQRINLVKPGMESPRFQRTAASVEAHEFAHLWFGDLVTNAWWDDIWLNEAFATWMAFHAVETFQQAWGEPEERTASMGRAMAADRLLSARRIRQPIESEGDIKTAFDTITYQKGAAVIRMFEEYVGEDRFRQGVQAYLRRHADGIATAGEFLAAISEAAGRDVTASFSSFLDQAGLPLVTVKVSCEGGKGRAALSQARYVPLGATRDPLPAQTWQVPVCLRTDRGRTCLLLSSATGTADLGECPRWVMPNAGAAGYYRTALDDAQTGKLTQAVAQLTAPERMAFFADLDAAAQAGAADLPRVFQLAAALGGDKDRHVVETVMPAIAFPANRGFFSDDALPKYAAFVRETFGGRARSLGFAEKDGEPEDARILRPKLLELVGNEGQDLQLRSEARKVADAWLADHRSTIPELASAALFLAALGGDVGFFEKLHAAAKAEKDRVERQRILGAMGDFRDPALVERGFQIFLADEFDPREAIALLWGPSSDPRTREAAMRFVQQSFDAIVRRMPRDYGAGLAGIGGGFCDEAHARVLEESFAPRVRAFPGGDRLTAWLQRRWVSTR